MSAWENVSGTWRKGTLWENVAGTWRRGALWENVGGTWRKDQSGSGQALSATASPTSVYGSVSRNRPFPVSTNVTTVTPSGGVAPYTYAWGAQPGWTIAAPTDSSTSFSAVAEPGASQLTTFTCTVADASGMTVTVSVDAEVDNYYSGGGVAQLQ